MMDSPFSEWTREEKDAFAKKKMEEMKLRNEQLKLRHAEVEKDRKKAEAKNSSVTSLKIMVKEKPATVDDDDFVPKPKVKEREWDIGKDMDYWDEPKTYRQQGAWKYYPERKHGKEDSWRNRSSNISKDTQASSPRFKPPRRSWSNKTYHESNNQASNYRNDSSNFVNRSKGYDKEKSTPIYQSQRKSHVKVNDSASQSHSDSEYDKGNQKVKNETDRMWRMEGSNDVRHRQIRVEKWVKSINNSGPDEEDSLIDLNQEREYLNRNWSEYEVGPHEKVDEGNYAHSKHNSIQVRLNKACGNDKNSHTSKIQRDGKKKIYINKKKLRRESDASDHLSSAKESDYPGYIKEKSGKLCNSKSSDNSEVDFLKADSLVYNEGDEIWGNIPEQSVKTQFPGDINERISDDEGIWSHLAPQSFNTPVPNKVGNNIDVEGIKSHLPSQSFNSPVPDKVDDVEESWSNLPHQCINTPVPDKIDNSDSDGIWSNLPAQSFDKMIPNKVDINSDVENYNKSKMHKPSNKQRKNKSRVRNLSSSEYSATCENPVKKQSDKRSNWKRSESRTHRRNKKCVGKLKTESKPSVSSTNENSAHLVESHEISSQEYDPSILVKIESHTVKRTFFNNNFTDSNKMGCNSLDEPAEYSQNKNESDIDPENVEEDSIHIDRDDDEYCEEFQHTESVEQVEDYQSLEITSLDLQYEDQDSSLFFDKLCISSPKNECGGPNDGGDLESEAENYIGEPCKKEYINSKYLENAENLEKNFTVSSGESVTTIPGHNNEFDSNSDKDGMWRDNQQSFSSLFPGIKSSSGKVAETSPDLVDQPLPGSVSEAPLGIIAHLPDEPMLKTTPGPIVKASSVSVLDEPLGPVIELSDGSAMEALPKPVVEGSPIPMEECSPDTVIKAPSASVLEESLVPVIELSGGSAVEAPSKPVAEGSSIPMAECSPDTVMKAPSASVLEESLVPVIELTDGPAVEPVVESSPIPKAECIPETVNYPCKSSQETNILVTSEDLIENAEERKDSVTKDYLILN